MRIFMVSPHYYPDTFQVTALSAAFVRRGHQVRILTGLPDYTTSRVPEAYRYFKNRRQWIDGVEVVRIPVIARRSGAFFRCMNYLSFALTAAIYCLFMRWQFDVIYVYGISPVTVIFPAAVLKKISNKKLFYYCMDIWPECVKVYGIGEASDRSCRRRCPGGDYRIRLWSLYWGRRRGRSRGAAAAVYGKYDAVQQLWRTGTRVRQEAFYRRTAFKPA